jgi:hypothetical protein
LNRATAMSITLIHLFQDRNTDVYAFSTDRSGANIPSQTPWTQWLFRETLSSLAFPEPWDIDDFQEVLDQLDAKGFYIFRGEFIQPLGLQPWPEVGM